MTVDRVLVRGLTARLSGRLVDAIEGDSTVGAGRRRLGLRDDRARLELMLGAWMVEEISLINQGRLQRGERLLDADDERSLRAEAYAETVGVGVLEPYMADRTVEQIDVNSYLQTWVSYSTGRKVNVGQLWESDEELTEYQNRLTLMIGVTESRLDEQSPSVTLQAPDGSRVVLVLGGAGRNGVSTNPKISIRRYVVNEVGLYGLAALGMFPGWLVPQLAALVRTGMTILVSGGPGAGKTTLLRELFAEVPRNERIVTVEKGLLELRLQDDGRHDDVVPLFTRDANTDGHGAVNPQELVELMRRLNPDRGAFSEILGAEALEMLDVASMCKRGSMATMHARDVRSVLPRLAFYIAESNTKLPEYAVSTLISETIDFVIHIDMVRNTSDAAPVRRVTSILECGGRGPDGGVRSTETWGLDDHGVFVQKAPLEDRHLRQLRLEGVDLGLFVPNDGLVAQ